MSILLCLGLLASLLVGHAQAATYFVALPPTGNDSRTCAQAQNEATPRASINKGIQCMSGGDTLVIEDGTYDEMINTIAGAPYTPIFLLPSGTSWAAPTRVRAKTIGGAILSLTKPMGDFYPLTLQPASFVSIEGLTVDNGFRFSGCATVDGGPVRFQDFTCKNSLGMGIDGYGTGHEFIRVHFDGMGWNPHTNQTTCEPKTCGNPAGVLCHGYCHSYYMFGSGHLVDGGSHRNVDGWAHHWYATNSVIRNETVIGYPRAVGGTILSGATGTIVYNNTYQDLRNAIFTVPNTEIVHNTILGHNTVNDPGSGTDNSFGIFQQCPNTSSSSCPAPNTIKNNLILQQYVHSSQRYVYVQGCDTCGSTGNRLVDTGVPAQVAGNMCDDANPGCAHASPSCFIMNPATHDLHLCATSPANNAGVTISGFTQPDKDKVPRAAGNMDSGAYQMVAGGPPVEPVATALTFSQTLVPVPEDEVFSLSVRIVDQAGVLVSSTAPVSLALGANPGGSTLSGVTTQAAVGGIATFNVSLNNPGTGYTLVASSPGLTSATSTPLTITAVSPPGPTGTPRVLILQH